MAERYDSVADTYGVGPDDYTVPATRSLLDLVGDVDRLRVLDLACGHGPIAREMARRGAKVVGLDVSPRLLARARTSETDEPLGIVYVHGDASDVRTLAGEQFDLVVCNFGLSDIDDLDGVCESVTRLLRSNGRFVFSILHPCFPGVADVSGSWPTDAGYYDEGWWIADGRLSGLRREVGANHRMLSSYLNALIAHDLSIEVVAEPPPQEDWATRRPGARALPVYLVVRSKPSADRLAD